MRVNLVKPKTIRNYTDLHAGSRLPFSKWLLKLKNANWETPLDILRTFDSADLLGNGTNRVVFDVGGNNYRMICKYGFGRKEVQLFICWIGTHANYSGLCNKNKQYFISEY